MALQLLILLAWLGLGVDSNLQILCTFVYKHVISTRTSFLLLTGVSCVLLLQAVTVSFAGDFMYCILPSSLGNSFAGTCLAMLGRSLVAFVSCVLLLQAVTVSFAVFDRCETAPAHWRLADSSCLPRRTNSS